MFEYNSNQVFYEIEILAKAPTTEIWLGCMAGHFVQKAIGTLKSSLMPGEYTVEFGLGTQCYKIDLQKNDKFKQVDLEKEIPIIRPAPKFEDEAI